MIVPDNGSIDETGKIARAFAESGPRFRYVRPEQSRGVPWNVNRVRDLARAPLLLRNVADDVVEPQHLVRRRESLLWRLLAYDVKRNATRLRRGQYQGAYSASSGYWA